MASAVGDALRGRVPPGSRGPGSPGDPGRGAPRPGDARARVGPAGAGPCPGSGAASGAGARPGRGAGPAGGGGAASPVLLVGDPHPGQGFRAAPPGPSRRHPAAHPGLRDRAAPRGRQGRAVLPARLRRRPRHGHRLLLRRPARQSPEPCPRAGLHGPSLHHPGDDAPRGRLQGARTIPSTAISARRAPSTS